MHFTELSYNDSLEKTMMLGQKAEGEEGDRE